MNTGDVIRRVQRIFGDNTEAQIYITDILDWINDAQLEIVRQTKCLTVKKDFDATGTAGPFALPADFLFEERVTFDGLVQVRTNLQDLDSYVTISAGVSYDVPSYYYLWQDALWLYPVPVRQGTGMLSLWYVQAPATISTQGAPLGLQLPYHEDIVRYCLMRAHELNENYTAADRTSNDLFTRLGVSRDQSQNQATSYPAVRDYEGDFWSVVDTW